MMNRVFKFAACFLLASTALTVISPVYGQVENQITITGTGAYNSSFSPSYEGGILIGIRSDGTGDFRLGVMHRKLLVHVGHPETYLSIVGMGSKQIFGPFGFHIQGELRNGSYFQMDDVTSKMVVKKAANLFGGMGVNFQVNQHIQLMGSYVIQDYDPRRYVMQDKSPHATGAVKFTLNYTLPLGLLFQSRNYTY